MTESESVALPFGDSPKSFALNCCLVHRAHLIYQTLTQNASIFFNFFQKIFIFIIALTLLHFCVLFCRVPRTAPILLSVPFNSLHRTFERHDTGRCRSRIPEAHPFRCAAASQGSSLRCAAASCGKTFSLVLPALLLFNIMFPTLRRRKVYPVLIILFSRFAGLILYL